MGGMSDHIEAPTITELRKKTQAWAREVREQGIMIVRLGWDRDRVEETESGYRILVRAHT